MTPRQAIARMARGERLAFVDARPAETLERNGCRIPGAIPIAPGARGALSLPAAATLVVYAEHARSYEAAAVAEQLEARGFVDVRVLAGGFAGWSELRCPTELAAARSRDPERVRRALGRPALRVVPKLRLVPAQP